MKARRAVSSCCLVAILACVPASDTPPAEILREREGTDNPQSWYGDYADPEYPDRGWWRKLTIAPGPSSATAQVSMTSSSTRVGRDDPDCSYSGIGSLVDGRLEAPLEWTAPDGTPVVMTLTQKAGGIIISARGGSDPLLGLGWYCRGGGTLAGEYPRVP